MSQPKRASDPSGPLDLAAGFAAFAQPKDRKLFASLLERGLGFEATDHLLGAFAAQYKLRARTLGIDEDAYLHLLGVDGPAAQTEWMGIAPALVVGETFLFRDAQLCELIERKLLPDLSSLARPLWLWSAGCSTGEEAYTLAIIARRAVGATGARVLGTDVNPKAIAAARVGVYGQWSLRGSVGMHVDGLIPNGTNTVRVDDEVKDMVCFEAHNLNDHRSYPPAGAPTFELIMCRNVLIYMSRAARNQIIADLVAALTPGGLLVLGHGELSGTDLPGLLVEIHDAGVVYRKPLAAAASIARVERRPAAAKSATRPARRAAPISHAGRAKGRPPHETAKTGQGKPVAGARSRDLLDAALSDARSGKMEVAERNAAGAVALDPLDPEPHVLVAALMVARGALSEAERELRRALYLDPFFVPALWQMGCLYGVTDRKKQSTYVFARALTKLEGRPPDEMALPFDNLTVGELSILLRAELGDRVDA